MPGGPCAGLAVTACQGQIWAIGGNTMLREDPRILDRVEVCDVATNTWARRSQAKSSTRSGLGKWRSKWCLEMPPFGWMATTSSCSRWKCNRR